MAKVIMVQGTMSGAGKSLVVAGLCRVFAQDGYRVAPFKSQNMALNSYITVEGLEMGRAQVMQAEAAGIEPSVHMNPILLKPTSDSGSQVIVNGEVIGNMKAKDYFEYKKKLVPDILKAFRELEKETDIIVIEGAGSPAEINLKSNDIVNMGMADMVDAPVLLVGDIDRGGVFAQLLGTIMLLEEQEKQRIAGLIINKFRGDRTILDPGIAMLVEKCNIPVAGVLPYIDVVVDDEDSLTDRFDRNVRGIVDIVVVRLPRISNISDYSCFEQIEGVSVRYIKRPEEIDGADMLIVPGSKNTIGDLKWLRESGFEAAIKKFSEKNVVFGICGGYQMLGEWIEDPDNVEEGGSIRGMELLGVRTMLGTNKKRTRVTGRFASLNGPLANLSSAPIEGYEIHMGNTYVEKGEAVTFYEDMNMTSEGRADGCQNGNVYGCYLHGIFDCGDIAWKLVDELARKKGQILTKNCAGNYRAFKESQYDKLADMIRSNMDMDRIYAMLREASVK